MAVIAKSAKTHDSAKKCCGWEEPAIYMKAKPPDRHRTLIIFWFPTPRE